MKLEPGRDIPQKLAFQLLATCSPGLGLPGQRQGASRGPCRSQHRKHRQSSPQGDGSQSE